MENKTNIFKKNTKVYFAKTVVRTYIYSITSKGKR